MHIILSLPQLLLGGALAMLIGGGLLLVTLARLSHSAGDTCLVVGWVDSLGWSMLALSTLALIVIVVSILPSP